MKGFKIFLVVIASIVVLSLFFATLGVTAEVTTRPIREAFTNNENYIAYDLHVEFISNAKLNDAVVINATDTRATPDRFQDVNITGNNVTLFNGNVTKGDTITVAFNVSGTFPLKKTWWWTNATGSPLPPLDPKDHSKPKNPHYDTVTPLSNIGGKASIPLPTDEATVDFPAGALEIETVVTLSEELHIPNPTAVPQGFLPIIKALGIELDPDPGTLAAPATVTIPYTDEEIEGYNEAMLQILRYDDNAGTWHVIPSTVDTANNVVTFERDHFSIYGIGGTPPPAVGGIVELPGIEEPGTVIPDSSGHNYGALAGIIVGATVGTIMLISAVWYIRRRRTKAI